MKQRWSGGYQGLKRRQESLSGRSGSEKGSDYPEGALRFREQEILAMECFSRQGGKSGEFASGFGREPF